VQFEYASFFFEFISNLWEFDGSKFDIDGALDFARTIATFV
jgi:hypothetical protein